MMLSPSYSKAGGIITLPLPKCDFSGPVAAEYALDLSKVGITQPESASFRFTYGASQLQNGISIGVGRFRWTNALSVRVLSVEAYVVFTTKRTSSGPYDLHHNPEGLPKAEAWNNLDEFEFPERAVPTGAKKVFSVNVVGAIQIVIAFRVRPQLVPERVSSQTLTIKKPDLGAPLGTILDLTRSPHPHDIQLHFPGNRTLYTSSAVLLISPYYETLLSSDGFLESASHVDVEQAQHDSTGSFEDDSDDDLDAVDEKEEQVRPSKKRKVGDGHAACSALYRHIVPSEVSYPTFAAVLVWLYTHRITFAPLSSTFLFGTSTDPALTRAEWLAKHCKSNGGLPPVSPKSVYRLADFLGLEQLKQLAFDFFVRQLTGQNVAIEMYSSTSVKYTPVRDACLNFASKVWSEVKKSQAYAYVEEQDRAYEQDESKGRPMNPKITHALIKLL